MNTDTISFVDFAAELDPSSPTTSVQKDRTFESLKGKPVTWEGYVYEVNSDMVLIKEKLSTMTYDVQLEVDSAEQSKLAGLSRGMKVRYTGTLDSYGGAVLSDRLTNGRILSNSTVSEVDMARELSDTESAIISHFKR